MTAGPTRAPGAGALRVRERTAPGRGAVRVLAVLGPGAAARVERLTGARPPRPGEALLRRLRNVAGARGADGAPELLDEALVVGVGPEELELHLHGSPVVVARVLAALGAGSTAAPQGAPLPESEAGALERRAAALLPHAPGDRAARVLLDQAEGALRPALEEVLAHVRARRTSAAAVTAARLLRRWDVTRRLLTPPRVVLAGPTNAGKSTLFNLLLGHERVLVSETEGTTRDAIRERAPLGAWVVEWVDTAGERALGEAAAAGAGRVEAAGQARGRDLRAGADLVLWASRDPAAEVPPGAAGLWTCADAAGPRTPAPGDRPALSALADPRGTRERIEALVMERLALAPEPWTPGAASPFEREQARALAGDPLSPADLERLLG